MFVFWLIQNQVYIYIILDIEDVNKALKEVKTALDTKTC